MGSEFLAPLQHRIEQALTTSLSQSTASHYLTEAMRYATLNGGKRLRAALVYMGCEALELDLELGDSTSLAIELVHAYSLVHDDLPAMDDDDLRHGQAATHIAFGEANAILAGDSLHSLAFQALAEASGLSDAAKLRSIMLLSQAAGWSGMAGGQCLDIEAEGKELSLTELEELHAAKTGALIQSSLVIGGYCAEVDPSDPRLALLRQFGGRIGLAFQVVDDILDVTASSETMGKPAGSDEALDKNTFPKLMGLKEAQMRANELLEESLTLLEKPDLATAMLTELANRAVRRSY